MATMPEMPRNGSANDQRILVVDDEPSIVDAVATALRYEGYVGRKRRKGARDYVGRW